MSRVLQRGVEEEGGGGGGVERVLQRWGGGYDPRPHFWLVMGRLLLAISQQCFFFINSQVTYVVYLLFTRCIGCVAGGLISVEFLRWKTPPRPAATQATRHTLIFACVHANLLSPSENTTLFSLELDYYKISTDENSSSEWNVTIPYKPGGKIEKTEETQNVLRNKTKCLQQTGGT